MLSDFEMITHAFPGGHDIKLYPVFDVHWSAPECMEQAFLDFVDRVLKEEHSYVILGGDLLDNGIRNSVTSVYKQRYMPGEAKRRMIEILKPLAEQGKIICGTKGNHEHRSSKEVDDDIMLDIFSCLGIEHLYRENICFVKIQLGKEQRNCAGDKRPCYVLAVTHGSGGGFLTGSAVNRSERFGYVFSGMMDALVVGHTHKPYTTQPGKIHIDPYNNKVTIKPFKVVSATSWLSWGGYAANKMLLPTTCCLNSLTLCGDHKEIIVTM